MPLNRQNNIRLTSDVIKIPLSRTNNEAILRHIHIKVILIIRIKAIYFSQSLYVPIETYLSEQTIWFYFG